MAEGLQIGVAPNRRHLDLAADRYREIADLVAARKEPGLVALDSGGLEFVPLASLTEERLQEFGVGPETAESAFNHLSELNPAREVAVIVVDRAGTGAPVAGWVNLLLNDEP